MSDYTRIIARLKKAKIDYEIERPERVDKEYANTLIIFSAVKIWISPSKQIVGMSIFDIFNYNAKCLAYWSNDR